MELSSKEELIRTGREDLDEEPKEKVICEEAILASWPWTCTRDLEDMEGDT